MKESLLFKEFIEYFDSFLSKYQCGYRKGLGAKYYIASMLEKLKSAVGNRKSFTALKRALLDLIIWHTMLILLK